MKKFWNWKRLTFLCALVAPVVAVGAIFVYLYIIPSNMERCETQQKIVSKNSRGDEVKMNEELCDGLANSATTILLLTMKGTKTSKPFFIYDLGSNDPTFVWTDNNTLQVHVEAEKKSIYKQLDHVSDVAIRYSSGTKTTTPP
jgi:hypothetical protein